MVVYLISCVKGEKHFKCLVTSSFGFSKNYFCCNRKISIWLSSNLAMVTGWQWSIYYLRLYIHHSLQVISEREVLVDLLSCYLTWTLIYRLTLVVAFSLSLFHKKTLFLICASDSFDFRIKDKISWGLDSHTRLENFLY